VLKLYDAAGARERSRSLSHEAWLESDPQLREKCVVQGVRKINLMADGDEVVVRSVWIQKRGFVLQCPATIKLKFNGLRRSARMVSNVFEMRQLSEETRREIQALFFKARAEAFVKKQCGDVVLFELADRDSRQIFYDVAKRMALTPKGSAQETTINNSRQPSAKGGSKKELDQALAQAMREIGQASGGQQPAGVVPEPTGEQLSCQTLQSLSHLHQRWHFDAQPGPRDRKLWSVVVMLTGGQEMTDFYFKNIPPTQPWSLAAAVACLDAAEFDPGAGQAQVVPFCTIGMFSDECAHRGRGAITRFCPTVLTDLRMAMYCQVYFDHPNHSTSELPLQLDKVCAPWESQAQNELVVKELQEHCGLGAGETVDTMIQVLIDQKVVHPKEKWPSQQGQECDYRVRCSKADRLVCQMCKISLCSVHMSTHHHYYDRTTD